MYFFKIVRDKKISGQAVQKKQGENFAKKTMPAAVCWELRKGAGVSI
jgi:hypothetical protein